MTETNRNLTPDGRLKAGDLGKIAAEIREAWHLGDGNSAVLMKPDTLQAWADRALKGSEVLADITDQLRELRMASGCHPGASHVVVRDTVAQQSATINDLSERLMTAREDLETARQALEQVQQERNTLRHDLEHAQRDRDAALDEATERNQRLNAQARNIENYARQVRALQTELDQARSAQSNMKENYEAATEVLNEVREALGTPGNADIVAHARQIAEDHKRFRGTETSNGILVRHIRDVLGTEMGTCVVEDAKRKAIAAAWQQHFKDQRDNTRSKLLRTLERLGDEREKHKRHLSQLAEALGHDSKDRPSVQYLISEASRLVQARNHALQNRDDALQERDEAVQRSKAAAEDRDRAIVARDRAIQERDWAARGRDDAIKKLRAAQDRTINGRPVTEALADLVLTRKRQLDSLESDRTLPYKAWGGILKDEATHFNYLARKDGDNRSHRLRNAALRIAGLCLAFVEALDGVTEEDLKQ